MIHPQKWMMKRPGLLIPVFFFYLIPVSGQPFWQESAVSALGGTFVTHQGYFNGRHNQAGLGWIEQHSFSVEHNRPFAMKELGISSMSSQVRAGNGAFGATLSSFGITGLRYTSAWISYGMKLSPGISCGLGVHFWNASIPERIFYHPGISCALGIQMRMNERLVIGAHVMHPVSWSANLPGPRRQIMLISTGWSYTFFRTSTFYSEIHIMPQNYLQLSHGIEVKFNDRFGLMMGLHNQPFSVSGGIALTLSQWLFHLAFEYVTDTGSSPSSSFTYAW